jgi:hypothetical protein
MYPAMEQPPYVLRSLRGPRRLNMSADRLAIIRRQPQKAEAGDEGEQSHQKKGKPEILDCNLRRSGDNRQRRRRDRDAKAARYLLATPATIVPLLNSGPGISA